MCVWGYQLVDIILGCIYREHVGRPASTFSDKANRALPCDTNTHIQNIDFLLGNHVILLDKKS